MKRLSVRPITLVRFDDWRKIPIALKMPGTGILSDNGLRYVNARCDRHHPKCFMYIRYRLRPNPTIPTISSAYVTRFRGFLRNAKNGSPFFLAESVSHATPI